jgi:hypothetical protein
MAYPISRHTYLTIPNESPRTGEVLSLNSAAPTCIGPASNLSVVCAYRDECQNAGPWPPNHQFEYGWVSCRHWIDSLNQWINCHVSPDGLTFTVNLNPNRAGLKSRALELFELNPRLVVNWSEQYLLQCANGPAVRTFMARQGIPETTPFALPEFTIEESCGYGIAGKARDDTMIMVSSWVLYDRNETESTLRHELAHTIVNRCGLREPNSHGENFKRVLKTIAPTTWEKDWYCTPTPAMRAAKERIHGDESQSNRQVCEVAS